MLNSSNKGKYIKTFNFWPNSSTFSFYMCREYKSRMRNAMIRGYSLCMLLLVLISSCGTNNNPAFTDLFPVRVGKLYGFMDRKGKMAIAPQYSQAGCFIDGLALIGTTGEKIKWGYIDKTGNYLIYPAYTDATSFSEGIAFVVSENGAPAAIDKNGAVKFMLKGAEQAQNFREGLAAYSVLTENGERWGFVDKDGRTKIEPRFAGTGFFSGALCPVVDEDGKWGFINNEGTMVIDYKYDNVSPFYGKVAKVCVADKWGLVDNTGKLLVSPQYTNIDIDKDKFLVSLDDKFGWVDKNGKVVIEARFADGFPFNESEYAAVRSGDKWGYINNAGKFVIDPTFDFAFGFDGDLAPVRVSNKVGFIDKAGKMAIPPFADDISMDYYLRTFAKTSAFSSVTTNDSAPTFVGYKWLSKFYHLQFEEAKIVSTEATKTLLTKFSGLTSLMPDSSKQEMLKIRVGVMGCTMNDSNAVLEYITSDNPGKGQTLYMVKKEGKWLVQFTKNDAMAGSTEEGGTTDADTSAE